MTLSFGVVALVALSSVAIFARLKPDAGAEVSGQRRARSRTPSAGGVTPALTRARRGSRVAST